ncbi:unnamed protein product [Pieris macdunnoughi]|uniref:Uncharacterized protein n=1 Tax=Pieris macdunnoughi TaxID=345717 RepID=A0A821XZ39_9NEOP|nr:unnamed protein product [Pieris macdunnoughi]
MTTSGLCNTESDPTTKASQSAEDEQCEINSDILPSVLDEENGNKRFVKANCRIHFRNVFNNLNDHSLEQPATWNHKVLLIKSVIKYYADVRLHYLHKNVNKITKRQKYNKLILFQGE